MNGIFTYDDYRKILADYYGERKKSNPWFSYQVFANKAGIANKGFLYNVIRGIKRLSAERALRLSLAMKLTAAEAMYFENLVSFNQAKNLRDRNYFFRKLCALRTETAGTEEVHEIDGKVPEYYFAKEAAA
jgi:uncharacterized protein (TIGR02147 family)